MVNDDNDLQIPDSIGGQKFRTSGFISIAEWQGTSINWPSSHPRRKAAHVIIDSRKVIMTPVEENQQLSKMARADIIPGRAHHVTGRLIGPCFVYQQRGRLRRQPRSRRPLLYFSLEFRYIDRGILNYLILNGILPCCPPCLARVSSRGTCPLRRKRR